MSSTRTMGISVTDVSTEAQLPLGFEYHQPADSVNAFGERVWVYIYNDDGANAFDVGMIVYRVPSASALSAGNAEMWGGLRTPITIHQAKLMVLGVAQHSIAGGSYGFVLKRGIGFVKAGSVTVTADTAFTTGGDDVGCALIYADDAATLSANIGVIGHTSAALVADAATVPAFISCGM